MFHIFLYKTHAQYCLCPTTKLLNTQKSLPSPIKQSASPPSAALLLQLVACSSFFMVSYLNSRHFCPYVSSIRELTAAYLSTSSPFVVSVIIPQSVSMVMLVPFAPCRNIQIVGEWIVIIRWKGNKTAGCFGTFHEQSRWYSKIWVQTIIAKYKYKLLL